MKFKQVNDGHIDILDDNGEKVGHIFTPAGSGGSNMNAIQVCGFSEAFDLWGCGIFRGTKDIQLLFDGKKMGGRHINEWNNSPRDNSINAASRCIRCYMEPCQCENFEEYPMSNDDAVLTEFGKKFPNPFNVKRESDLKDRIIYKKSKGVENDE